VIGPGWATIIGADGKRRLEDANDFVRLEVASALARNIAVIPVLVHEARMPHPDQLPENIKDLAYRNSVEISHSRWNSDVQLLVKALNQYVTTSAATESEPVHATMPVQLPPPVSSAPPPDMKSSKMPLILGSSVAVLLLLGVAGYFAMRKPPVPQTNVVTPANGSTTPTGAQPAVSTAGLGGSWRNNRVKQGGDGVIELHVTGSNPRYRVEVLGSCPQGECSWGTQNVTFDGVQGVAMWSPRVTQPDIDMSRTALLTLRPAGDVLDVHVENTWHPQPGQARRNNLNFEFVREQ
jgi:hypothetical protein